MKDRAALGVIRDAEDRGLCVRFMGSFRMHISHCVVFHSDSNLVALSWRELLVTRELVSPMSAEPGVTSV